MNIQANIKNLKNYKIYLQVQKATEEFLEKKGYLKIDLPVLSPALIPESYLEVFETEFKYFNHKEKLYLTPSPELFLKRLLAYGVGDCYYLGKSFRNADPPSTLHSFEFTMLEIYKINVSYLELADEILEMLKYINKSLKSKIKSQKFNLNKWEKITVAQAFEKYAGIKKETLFNHQLFLIKAKEKGYQIENSSYEDVWSQIYVQEVEPNLGKNGYPTLIYDYPKEFAALAKLNPDGKTAQRFEFYINGIELGDCYTELTDPKEQEQRFLNEDKQRKKLKKISHPIDKGFIEALKYGLAPCSGIAIGFERLAMIFAQVDSIDKLKLINIL
ncbi:MAG: amino acid--tRNA ligase-related protein [Microgenomates group bacterium]